MEIRAKQADVRTKLSEPSQVGRSGPVPTRRYDYLWAPSEHVVRVLAFAPDRGRLQTLNGQRLWSGGLGLESDRPG